MTIILDRPLPASLQLFQPSSVCSHTLEHLSIQDLCTTSREISNLKERRRGTQYQVNYKENWIYLHQVGICCILHKNTKLETQMLLQLAMCSPPASLPKKIHKALLGQMKAINLTAALHFTVMAIIISIDVTAHIHTYSYIHSTLSGNFLCMCL